mmetsp:Transcript_8573/g.14239  ORF Transcript_8573/g.14239 Transcript_8573/m.14239 type:complete len:304 (+) Transcript_8573:402-1313(+)
MSNRRQSMNGKTTATNPKAVPSSVINATSGGRKAPATSTDIGVTVAAVAVPPPNKTPVIIVPHAPSSSSAGSTGADARIEAEVGAATAGERSNRSRGEGSSSSSGSNADNHRPKSRQYTSSTGSRDGVSRTGTAEKAPKKYYKDDNDNNSSNNNSKVPSRNGTSTARATLNQMRSMETTELLSGEFANQAVERALTNVMSGLIKSSGKLTLEVEEVADDSVIKNSEQEKEEPALITTELEESIEDTTTAGGAIATGTAVDNGKEDVLDEDAVSANKAGKSVPLVIEEEEASANEYSVDFESTA